MDGDAPRSEIVDTQYTADDIATHVIKHQHLPDRIPILVQNWGGDQALRGGLMGTVSGGLRVMVQIEDFLDGSCRFDESAHATQIPGRDSFKKPTNLTVAKGHGRGCHCGLPRLDGAST